MRPDLEPYAFGDKLGVASSQGIEAFPEEDRAPGVVCEVLACEHRRATGLDNDSMDGGHDRNGWRSECYGLAEVPELVQDGVHGCCVICVRNDNTTVPPSVLLAHVLQQPELFDVAAYDGAGVTVALSA